MTAAEFSDDYGLLAIIVTFLCGLAIYGTRSARKLERWRREEAEGGAWLQNDVAVTHDSQTFQPPPQCREPPDRIDVHIVASSVHLYVRAPSQPRRGKRRN